MQLRYYSLLSNLLSRWRQNIYEEKEMSIFEFIKQCEKCLRRKTCHFQGCILDEKPKRNDNKLEEALGHKSRDEN